MNNKAVGVIVIISLAASVQFCKASANSKADGAEKNFALQVHLPREITIRGEESLVARAGKIVLGRISVPGQKITVDRSMVLSRLACNGIPASKVTLTGAEKTTVKQQQRIIKPSEFVELASSFLKANPTANSVCQWDLIRTPKDLVVPASRNIKLSPSLARGGTRNQARIQINVLANSNFSPEVQLSNSSNAC